MDPSGHIHQTLCKKEIKKLLITMIFFASRRNYIYKYFEELSNKILRRVKDSIVADLGNLLAHCSVAKKRLSPRLSKIKTHRLWKQSDY